MIKTLSHKNDTQLNIFVYAGEEWNKVIKAKKDGVDWDLTGAAITMNVKKKLSDTSTVQTLEVGTGITIDTNEIAINPDPLAVGEYLYSIEVVPVSGEKFHITGKIISTKHS